MAKLATHGTILALVILTGAWGAEAQTAPRVAVSVEGGVNLGGPWKHHEETLRGAGMTDVHPFGGGFFSPEPVSSPNSDRGAAWGLDIRMRVRPRFSVGVNAARSSDGSTHGYDAGVLALGIGFTAIHKMATIAPVVTWHPTPRLRLGAGPALHRLEYESPEARLALRKSTVGVLAQAAYMFWDGRSFFSEITGQYRGVGALSVPSVTLTEEPFFPSPAPPYALVLPAGDVPFQNWSVGVSFGVRLR